MTLPPVTFTDEFVKWVASIEGASVLNRDLARNVLDAREEAERLRGELREAVRLLREVPGQCSWCIHYEGDDLTDKPWFDAVSALLGRVGND